MALARAELIRSGLPSVAAIEPEASMMKTVCGLSGAAVARCGRAREAARRITASNWSRSRTLGRRRCQGVAEETGRAISCHRKVELTSTAGRLGRSMWSRSTGTARVSSHQAAGSAKVMAGSPRGRPEGRWEGGPDGRPEGRWEGGPDGRAEGGPDGRPEGGRAGRRGGGPEGRPEGGPEGGPDGGPEGGPDGRPEGGPDNPCLHTGYPAHPRQRHQLRQRHRHRHRHRRPLRGESSQDAVLPPGGHEERFHRLLRGDGHVGGADLVAAVAHAGPPAGDAVLVAGRRLCG